MCLHVMLLPPSSLVDDFDPGIVFILTRIVLRIRPTPLLHVVEPLLLELPLLPMILLQLPLHRTGGRRLGKTVRSTTVIGFVPHSFWFYSV